MLSIQPAVLAFDASGTPCSREFGDIYHNAASGPGQARHVFLHGNGLPERWAGTRHFVIVEAGFGIGLNFLATWKTWRDDERRCAHLHFVSIERHPFSATDLARLHAAYPEFAGLAQELRNAWPALVPGLHRLHFDQGQVTLTLAFADVAKAVGELRLMADAFYLDGFAPETNPAMWSPQVLRGLGRLAAPQATLATWSVARAVRDALEAVGFVVDRRPGFGGKREMLAAHYAPRWPNRRASPGWECQERRAIVIGAGLAGTAVATRLAARGWVIDLIDRAAIAGSAASGLYAGAVQPHVSRDDCLLSRFTRAGFLHARRARPASATHAPWQQCGVLQLADDAANEARTAATAAQLDYPLTYAEYVTRASASELAGAEVRIGGWWFPQAGWVQPGALVRGQLALAGAQITTHFGREAACLTRVGDRWRVDDAGGTRIAEAPVVVLANANDAARLVDLGADVLRRVRGQQSHLPAPPFVAPRTIVGGDGYVFPAIDGIAVAGATYDLDATAPQPDAAGHAANLARVEHMLPGSTVGVAASTLEGRVGFRCVATDRMPMLGALVDVARARLQARALTGAQLADLPRVAGLYGAFAFASRGLAWTPLAAELLASQIESEPLPLEGVLVDAIDPGRFVMHRLRRSMLK
ncbi:MAG: bifunctional tRNA (5-methylaminomethyl-2-thiouridine)(34)-methyltransferase MnmD/FAD-dependent 5-carboxymethylaminomethyl-2-thiouridine(34) oxidoreductase MnmC [Casimicrobiaceae bacterium]